MSAHLSIRLTPGGADTLRWVAEKMGLSETAVLEVQSRLALAKITPGPSEAYKRWIAAQVKQLGTLPLVVLNRRVTPDGKEAIDALADRWGDSQSGVAEYLVWYAAQHWLHGQDRVAA